MPLDRAKKFRKITEDALKDIVPAFKRRIEPPRAVA
jgi:hypothetical protein